MYTQIAQAEVSVYTIEGQIRAAFPAEPRFVGEAGPENQRVRSYQAIDPDSVLIYSVTWQIDKTPFKKSDIPNALRYHAEGDALAVGSKVTSFNYVNIHGRSGSEYVIEYNSQGYKVVKYSATFYDDGQFYSWSVQEIVGMSRSRAKNAFRTYLEHFSLE